MRKNDLLMLGLSLVLFAVLQVLISTRVLSSFWELNLIVIGINVIMAASLNLINGYTGQFSLGHAGFMAVGAYTGVVMTSYFHLPFIVHFQKLPAFLRGLAEPVLSQHLQILSQLRGQALIIAVQVSSLPFRNL